MNLSEAVSTPDDLEPLFDYRRVQPQNIVCIDGTSPVPSPKRRKCPKSVVAEVDLDKDVELIKVVNVEEEDWLAPPPMVSSNAHRKVGEDSTIKELSFQNKDELKQFRVYTDDKFEKLFRLYANKAKLELQSLVFSFDGDKINVDATPASLEMEDDDIIKVHVKKC
ncbi:Bidirectional amino acid transporter 1 [Hibiscus syriacus]|uniref:Bidirectional amino acid transporter 1 n=1 Tax=Hibiscus syriacus TaxID=106335 RepID=A0A6A3CUB4_HIBSY|nr:Bidirectional amino acid transporter 1 [Hibiscus syriacus]